MKHPNLDKYIFYIPKEHIGRKLEDILKDMKEENK